MASVVVRNRNDHTSNSEGVSFSRCLGRTKTSERQDEANRCDEVGKACHGSTHGYPLFPLFFLEHGEHALGYDEATEDVHRCQAHRDKAHHFRKA